MLAGYTERMVGMYTAKGGDIPLTGASIPQRLLPHYPTPPQPVKDFILVAEFSELEGPRPLITIPSNPGNDFDLNEFSIRVMSVDYQHNIVRGPFHGTEDNHLIVSEEKNGIHAYVHHLTLYDAQARGYVRPFCLCYVTANQKKLTAFYDEISAVFIKNSDMLKYASLMRFQRDLKHRLEDLMHTKGQYLLWHEKKLKVDEKKKKNSKSSPALEEDILANTNSSALDTAIVEVSNIYEKISPLLVNKSLEALFYKLDDAAKANRSRADSSSSGLSSSYQETSPIKQQLKRSGSMSDLYHDSYPSCTVTDTYQPRLTKPTGGGKFDKTLKTLYELCHWGAKEALQGLREFHQNFKQDYMLLELERMEKISCDCEEGNISVGPCYVGNILPLIPRPKQKKLSKTEDENAVTPMTPGSTLSKAISTDTYGSYESAESFLSCEEEPEDPTITATEQNSSLPENTEKPNLVNGFSGSYDIISTSSDNSPNTPEEPFRSEDLGLGISISDVGSVDTATQSSSDTITQGDEQLPDPGITVAALIKLLDINSQGSSMLKFVKNHAFSIHLLYSLLSGRTVVVTGQQKSEALVRNMVSRLCVLLPGYSSQTQCVQPWSTQPLKLKDVSHWKLVGLQQPGRKGAPSPIPQCLMTYVTVFDIEKKTLLSPEYKGKLLLPLTLRVQYFKSEGSYISHVHAHMSQFISMAYTYFHSVCLGNYRGDKKQLDQFRKSRDEFMKKKSLSDQDLRVIEYLIESAKISTQESQTENKQDGPPMLSVDYTRCHLFKS